LSPSRGCSLLTIDYLWSIAFYTAVIITLIGGVGMIRPLGRVHRGRRTHAATMLLIGLVAMYLISRAMPRAQSIGDHRPGGGIHAAAGRAP
jgi:preprotein translocase subunit Sss1